MVFMADTTPAPAGWSRSMGRGGGSRGSRKSFEELGSVKAIADKPREFPRESYGDYIYIFSNIYNFDF